MSQDAVGLLDGRTAVVTGGSRGIGAAIVSCLARSGARGVVFDLDIDPAIETLSGWSAIAADVRDEDSLSAGFRAAYERLGPLDVVVANAGIVPPWTETQAIDAEGWDTVFAVNARGVMLTVREAVRAMSGRGGSIVAIASINGWRGHPHIASYVASKHAVVGLVRSVALDLGREGVRINAVAPGTVATEALLSRMERREETTGVTVATALADAATETALGRIVTVDEVANCVLFLASDLSSGITGHLLPVDGGVA